MSDLVESIEEAGVVGAGGAGFPTHVKLAARAEWFLANGAECEPLLHKDRELMVHFAADILAGLALAAEAVGAAHSAIGVKSKNRAAVAALDRAAGGNGPSISEFGDFYPSGDEYEVVQSITGRLVPPGGIPLDVGVVVNNVETLYHVYRAAQGEPVVDTFLTVAGLVRRPQTLRLPVGMRMAEVLELTGGPTLGDFAVIDSGVMMGRLVHDLDRAITKTTAGLIVLPRSHNLVQRLGISSAAQARIGKSACDQCSYCTELCPRYLLGYDIQPHAVMRSLGFSSSGSEVWNRYALLCCGCGICTLYACPENLFPREACLRGIADLRAAGRGRWEGATEVRVHPMKEYRRVPMSLLMRKLGIEDYDTDACFEATEARPSTVRIPLRQHAGVAARPVVCLGDTVRRGQPLGEVPDGELGARVHSSIAGRVTRIEDFVEVERA